jgi:hypothetical protein
VLPNRYGLQKLLAYSTGWVDQERWRHACFVSENLFLPMGKPWGYRILPRSRSQLQSVSWICCPVMHPSTS